MKTLILAFLCLLCIILLLGLFFSYLYVVNVVIPVKNDFPKEVKKIKVKKVKLSKLTYDDLMKEETKYLN